MVSQQQRETAEIAPVLFMDSVGFSRRPWEERASLRCGLYRAYLERRLL